ncbi:hypothetical protein [Streptomyces sp. NPDC059479]|uniref:hypothetical protein n=1 Tax=Streptomyces sp. NPDC059479 TaxID=3346848 RepID=UPI00369247D4
MLLTLCFRGLRCLPVTLEPGPRFRLRLSSPGSRPTALRLVLVRIRHPDGMGEPAWGEGLDLFGPGQCAGPESRSPASCRQQTPQRLDPRVEFLRPPPGIRLALLPVRRPLLTMAARQVPLVGTLLPFLIPLIPRLRLQLALLLALRLSPDTDQPIGTTTHALQALPTRDSASTHQALAP